MIESTSPAAPVTPVTNTPEVSSTLNTEQVSPDAGTKPVEIKPDTNTGERKFKVKVDGRDIEVNESELVRGYSHAQAANQRLQEAAMTKKQATEFIDMLRNNPLKVLTNPNLGIDVKKIAEDYLIQQYQDEIDPKSAENRKLKQQLEEYESAKKAQEEEQKKQSYEQETQKLMTNYAKEIDDAFESCPNLPKTPAVYDRVIHWMKVAVAKDGVGLPASQIMPIVEQEFKEWTKDLYKNATPEQLFEYFGEDVAKKIRQQDLKRLKDPVPGKVNKTTSPAPKKSSKPMGLQDFREKLRLKDQGLV